MIFEQNGIRYGFEIPASDTPWREGSRKWIPYNRDVEFGYYYGDLTCTKSVKDVLSIGELPGPESELFAGCRETVGIKEGDYIRPGKGSLFRYLWEPKKSSMKILVNGSESSPEEFWREFLTQRGFITPCLVDLHDPEWWRTDSVHDERWRDLPDFDKIMEDANGFRNPISVACARYQHPVTWGFRSIHNDKETLWVPRLVWEDHLRSHRAEPVPSKTADVLCDLEGLAKKHGITMDAMRALLEP